MADPRIITDHTGRNIMLGGSAKTSTLGSLSAIFEGMLSDEARSAIREAAESYGRTDG